MHLVYTLELYGQTGKENIHAHSTNDDDKLCAGNERERQKKLYIE